MARDGAGTSLDSVCLLFLFWWLVAITANGQCRGEFKVSIIENQMARRNLNAGGKLVLERDRQEILARQTSKKNEIW